MINSKFIATFSIFSLFLLDRIGSIGAQEYSIANNALSALLSEGQLQHLQQQHLQQQQGNQQEKDNQRHAGGCGSGCESDILDIIKADQKFNRFEEKLSLANLEERFECNDSLYCNKYTIFAPSDAALTDPDIKPIVEKYTYDSEYRQLHLKSLLLYHIVEGAISASQIKENIPKDMNVNFLPNLYNGEHLNASIKNNGVIKIENSRVFQGDMVAKNGVIHGIASLLIPPFLTNDIVTVLQNLDSSKESLPTSPLARTTGTTRTNNGPGIFAEFVKGLTNAEFAAGRTSDTSRTNTFTSTTIFVPTDEAFVALFNDMGQPTEIEISEIFNYHVLANTIFVADGDDGADHETRCLTTLQGEGITATRYKQNSVFLNGINSGARIIRSDILASNGIVHVIDKVLLPPSFSNNPSTLPFRRTIKEIIENDNKFKFLIGELDSAELMNILDDDGYSDDCGSGYYPNQNSQYTLFAPTGAAFEKLGSAVLRLIGSDELKNILKYHIVPGKFGSEELTDGQTLLALSRENITSDYEAGDILLNGRVQLANTDIIASNGVIHMIDSVLLPKNIMDRLEENMEYTRLVEAIYQADLQRTINDSDPYTIFAPNDSGPYTIFAPTNQAFNNYFGDKNLSLVCHSDLVEILKYHIVPGMMTEDDLMETRVSISSSGNYDNSEEISAGSIDTLQMEEIVLTKKRKSRNNGSTYTQLVLNDSVNVTKTDILASNGVIHVVDKILVPESISLMPTSPTIGEIIAANDSDEEFNILKAALESSESVNIMNNLNDACTGPFTMFFPTDNAFRELGSAFLNLFGEKDLIDILKYHIIYGQKIRAGDFKNERIYETWSGDNIRVDKNNNSNRVFLNGNVEVELPNYAEASNGIIHVVSKVLLPKDILDILDYKRYSEFVNLIKSSSGVQSDLTKPGPFTIFVPTNAAMRSFVPHSQDAVDDILKYHILSGLITTDDLSQGRLRAPDSIRSVETLFPGESITITETSNSIVLNDNSTIITSDILASNGIIHIVDSVLIPPTFEEYYKRGSLPTIGEIIEEDILNEFDDFKALLKSVNLLDILKTSAGPFTLFAPTNEAFEEIAGSVIKLYGTDELADILNCHILSGKFYSNDFKDKSYNTQSGKNINIDVKNNGDILINANVEVTAVDTMASNGVIHVIDKVLLPTKIVDLAKDKGFTYFFEAVKNTDLWNKLKGSGPFTVFVPTNEAFRSLFGENISNVQDLDIELLKYHVILGRVTKDDFLEGRLREDPTAVSTRSFSPARTVESLQGDKITIQTQSSSSNIDFVLNGVSNIIDTNILASNGIIHVIDSVLIPPSDPTQQTIADIIKEGYGDEGFESLANALEFVGLLDSLGRTDSKPVTMFVPTDAAFLKLDKVLPTYVLNRILNYHVILDEEYFAQKLIDAGSLVTSSSDTIRFDVDNNGGVLLNDIIPLKINNIKASNGIIHVIDTVLLPTTILELASIYGYTNFAAAVNKAVLQDTLNDSSYQFTAFVPSNLAFDNYGGFSDIEASKLANILMYHIVPGLITESDLLEGRFRRNLDSSETGDTNSTKRHDNTRSIKTLTGEQILVEKSGNPGFDELVLNGVANVLETNIITSNGIIHIIDEVLEPPEQLPTVLATIREKSRYDSLEDALRSVDWMDDLLQNPDEPITIFAPKNAPFLRLGDAVTDLYGKDELRDILQNHILPGLVYVNDLEDDTQIKSVNGFSIDIRRENGDVTLNQFAKVVSKNIETSNGLIHTIDNILSPEDLIGTAISEGHTDFVALLGKLKGLRKKLNSRRGPFTVFIPKDAAFENFPEDISMLDDSDLNEILEYHVVRGIVTEDDLYKNSVVTLKTLQGNDIKINQDCDSRLVLNGQSKVINTNILASNGVIHVIDKVLEPYSHHGLLSIGEMFEANNGCEFEILKTALISTGLMDTFKGDGGPFTFFAPSDDAFRKLGNDSRQDSDDLKRLLKYHVVAGINIRSFDFRDVPLKTLGGGLINVDVKDDQIFLNGNVKLKTVNLIASNGIVHVIDEILLPEENNAKPYANVEEDNDATSSTIAVLGEVEEILGNVVNFIKYIFRG